MDSAHALAVVCRAKQICRENGLVARDEVLGYLCQCADISGAWGRLLGDRHGTAGINDMEHVLLQTAPDLQEASRRTPQNEVQPSGSDVDHVHLVKAIEKLARSIANHFAEDSIPVQLATIQMDMETMFNNEISCVENEQRERAERVALKAKVVFYTCMSARLDSALHDPTQEQEVKAAVESVFPFSSLAQFLTLPPTEKELQLKELPHIVAGICLFNKSTGTSEAGACIAALREHATIPIDTLQGCLEQLQCVRHNLLCYSRGIVNGEVGPIQDENLLWLQAHSMLMQLHAAVSASCTAVTKIASEIEASVSEVQLMLQELTAVPKQTVLPVFHRIGQLFEATLDERRQATVHNALLDRITKLIGSLPTSVLPIAAKHAPDETDLAALAESGSSELLGLLHDVKCVEDSSGGARENADKAGSEFDTAVVDVTGPDHLAWGGIDIVVFVRHKGLTISAIKDAMQVQYPADVGAWFGFSSDAAAEEFKLRSQEYINAACTLLLEKPHIIPLVGQVDDSVPPLLSRVMSMGYHILRLDYATQTPTHFVEQHIDSRYEWNQWALRRQALALANLQTKVTKSAQTGVSSFRRDNESQFWRPKVAMSQTPCSKGQSMPKKLRYMAGMRGDPICMKFSVVSLELDLGQPHQL